MAIADNVVTYSSYGSDTLQSFACGKAAMGDVTAICPVYCGFQHRRIELIMIDETDGSADMINIWQLGITAASTIMIDNAGAITVPTTLGPTVLDNSTGEGFTIPANQTGGVNADSIYWIAWR